MASPEKAIPAYGSSHSTGGILRGHAQGNTFNMADAGDVWDDINTYSAQKPEKGKIYLYISDLNPQEIDVMQPSFAVTVHNITKYQTIQHVIEHGSRDYSPIRRKLLYLLVII